MLTVSQVSKSFAGRILFEDVSLQVNRGDRIGLVGPNGAGKSTLFSLILGRASPDCGKVSLEKSATLGYLPQETAVAGEESVLELACGKSHQALDDEHDWEIEPKAKRILAGLAFRESDFARPARDLERRLDHARASRAAPRAGAGSPPARRADQPSRSRIVSLVSRIISRHYPGAILMISHDREFLNALVGSIVEIAQSKLIRYRGNWDSYVEQKAAREEQQLSAYKNQQKEIAAAPAICRPLSRQGEQGFAGAEQAQADRADGKNRGADSRGRRRSSSVFRSRREADCARSR